MRGVSVSIILLLAIGVHGQLASPDQQKKTDEQLIGFEK
jgi:hypothetical protein